MIAGHGLLAFRDPYGIRPLIIGATRPTDGTEYLVASESVALEALGFTVLRDVAPGEAIFIDQDGKLPQPASAPRTRSSIPCIFEFVYLARPDSVIDGISVYEARLRHGRDARRQDQRDDARAHDIDVVIPIPDSSRPSAMQLARTLGLPVPRGLHQEPLHRPHLHHAGPGDAQESRCARS